MASSSGCEPRAGAPSSRDDAPRAASVCRSEASPPDSKFPRVCRLTSRRQFRHVYDHGRRAGSKSLALFGAPNRLERSRLGITVTRKVGGAVRRNRIKRMLRDIFRRRRHELPTGLDLVVNAYRSLDTGDLRQLEGEFVHVCAQLARRLSR